jgi:hypothetical protein
MKLEQKVKQLIGETESTHFDVIAHELWGNSKDGFDCNSSWYLKRDADLSEVMEAARGRWEVFKVNYLPTARVRDIQDTGWDSTFSLEVDCVPFLEIRASK